MIPTAEPRAPVARPRPDGPLLSRAPLVALILLALGALARCADDPTTAAASDVGGWSFIPDSFGGIGEVYTRTPDADAGPAGCKTHADCGSSYCDRVTGACVECLAHGHCADPTPVCRAGSCAAATPCGPDAPCAAGVCAEAPTASGSTDAGDPTEGRCVDCLTDADCSGVPCRAQVCATGEVPCASTADCAPYGMQCQGGHCVDCLVDAHCAVEDYCGDAVCQPDVCVPGTVAPACRAEGHAVARCTDGGGAFEEIPCDEGWLCEPAVGGTTQARCAEVLCAPGDRQCTSDTSYGLCNEFGTSFINVTCPPGTSCFNDECRPPKPVIVVVFDTSSSMWGYPQGGIPDLCDKLGTPCVPPWPTCEEGSGGITLMGRCKQVFAELFETFAGKAHFVLMRFPQRETGAATPTCKSGYYMGLQTIDGDTDAHLAPDAPDGWFAKGLDEVALALLPPSEDESNLPQIQQWLDHTETIETTGGACEADADCAAGFCSPAQDGTKRCHTHTDPELRPIGQTPLGRSLFYAGEVIRQRVAVDGRPCGADADCGTPLHVCQSGACHDPGRACRKLVVLLFTDGAESVDTGLESWFHPRNQAKRLHYGLGCAQDSDCLSGAVCTEGTCQSEAFTPGGQICSDTGSWCQADTDCKAGTCGPDVSTFVDADGVQRLEDAAGNPISITVSVVTVGYEKGHAASVAAWGGGEAVSVQDASADVLLDELSKVVSAKIQAECTQ